jgi:hypothetical protein
LKQYKSMNDINRHLKILRLQADIHKQRTEIDAKYIKHSLKPTNLIAESVAVFGQKHLYRLIFKYFFKKLRF